MVETTIINNTFRVVSELPDLDGEHSDKEVPVVKYEFHYPVESPVPVISGYISAHQQREVRYSGPDAFRIKGQLMLTVKEKEVILNGNLYYGYNENPALQHHFDGTLALFRQIPPVPPPPPPDNDDGSDDLPPQTAIDAPLFPYINIQPWPDETPADSWLHFFSYNPAHTGAGSLYSQLVATAPQKDRKTMEQLCLQFLQNDAPFEGQYYESLQQVPAPFNSFPDLYDEWVKMADYCEGDDDITAGMDTSSWLPVIDQLWQNYFALAIITGFNESFAIAVNKILLICNLLETQYNTQPPRELTCADISHLLHATVILPSDIFPLPPYATAVSPKDNSWIAPYAIGQLKMSRYRLLRYQPGEIAGIQNVMKGEQKKIMQRQLSSDQEKISESAAENTSNISRYQQVSNDLLLEAKKTLAGFTQSTSYDNFTTTYGPPTQAVLNGKWSSTLKPDSDSIQSDSGFVSRILNSTVNRISESVTRTRSFSKYNEQESVTSSLFDNRHGDGHFRGIYRWLNKIYRVSVEHYGHRFLLELSIEQPAREYIQSQQSLNATDLQRPLSPAEMGITTYTDITVANYAQLLSYYQTDIIRQPPEPYAYVAVILSPGETEKYAAIPDNYFAVQATVTGIIAGGAPVRSISGIAGSALFELTDTTRTQTLDMNGERGQLPVSVIGPNTPEAPPYKPNDFTLNVRIQCGVTEEKMNEWKAQVYRQISEAWQKRLSVYINTLTRLAGEDEQGNPELLRNTERSALHRRCAALLMQVSSVKAGSSVTDDFQLNEPRYYQFLREALEWDEMTWVFDDSPSIFSYALQGRNDSLRPFLQAQRARVMLPVRPSFNFQLLYYLSSGIIWPAPYPFVPVNPADVRIAARLKSAYNDDPYTKIEHTWEIALPTAMQVVQESSELPEFTTPHHT